MVFDRSHPDFLKSSSSNQKFLGLKYDDSRNHFYFGKVELNLIRRSFIHLLEV